MSCLPASSAWTNSPTEWRCVFPPRPRDPQPAPLRHDDRVLRPLDSRHVPSRLSWNWSNSLRRRFNSPSKAVRRRRNSSANRRRWNSVRARGCDKLFALGSYGDELFLEPRSQLLHMFSVGLVFLLGERQRSAGPLQLRLSGDRVPRGAGPGKLGGREFDLLATDFVRQTLVLFEGPVLEFFPCASRVRSS